MQYRARAAIDIVFADRKLGATCADLQQSRKRWGQNATIVQRRLATLMAAETMADVVTVPGHFHALKGPRHGQYALNLWGPYRLVFEPLRVPPQHVADLRAILAVRILEIVDYHGH